MKSNCFWKLSWVDDESSINTKSVGFSPQVTGVLPVGCNGKYI